MRESQPEETELQTFLQSFARACIDASQNGPYKTAILPPLDPHDLNTPCSDYLADEITSSFLNAQAIILDRQHLTSILNEIDFKAVFDRNEIGAEIPGAHVLVAGRYSLVGGVFDLRLKAIEVSTGAVLVFKSCRLRHDQMLRQLAFSNQLHTSARDDLQVEETSQGLHIRTHYSEIGASELRLLDRARQRIRRALGDYQRNALGRPLTVDQIERLFRKGTEVDCVFESGSVTLEMAFGDMQ